MLGRTLTFGLQELSERERRAIATRDIRHFQTIMQFAPFPKGTLANAVPLALWFLERKGAIDITGKTGWRLLTSGL